MKRFFKKENLFFLLAPLLVGIIYETIKESYRFGFLVGIKHFFVYLLMGPVLFLTYGIFFTITYILCIYIIDLFVKKITNDNLKITLYFTLIYLIGMSSFLFYTYRSNDELLSNAIYLILLPFMAWFKYSVLKKKIVQASASL